MIGPLHYKLSRKGAVREHVQALNPITKRYVKIDTRTGRIVDHKKTPGPYKGVREITIREPAMTKDQQAAFVLFERLRRDGRPISLTTDTADDLSELGIKPPDQSEIMPVIPPDAVMLCLYETTPLVLPDNRLGACLACGKAVQCRPHVPITARLICASCALRSVVGDA
jgi:hypothetical protein